MKRFLFATVSIVFLLSTLTSCLGSLTGSSNRYELSGDLWVIESYRMRIDGVYDQTKGYDLYALVVDGDWLPGDMTVEYVRFPDAEESFSLVLMGKTEEVNISESNSVLFFYSHLGGPWDVEYNKGADTVTLHMDYTVSGVSHNDFITLKKTKAVKKGEKIKIK